MAKILNSHQYTLHLDGDVSPSETVNRIHREFIAQNRHLNYSQHNWNLTVKQNPSGSVTVSMSVADPNAIDWSAVLTSIGGLLIVLSVVLLCY